MKLKMSDFKYLGIDILKYSDEEIKLLKNNLQVEDLIKELCNEKNIIRSSIACSDIWESYKYKIHNDIHRSLADIYWEIYRKDTKELKDMENAYKVILEGMIELREKDINTLCEKFNVFRCDPKIEGSEIPDEELYQYVYDVLKTLKKRNIKRLKHLFEEKDKTKEETSIEISYVS